MMMMREQPASGADRGCILETYEAAAVRATTLTARAAVKNFPASSHPSWDGGRRDSTREAGRGAGATRRRKTRARRSTDGLPTPSQKRANRSAFPRMLLTRSLAHSLTPSRARPLTPTIPPSLPPSLTPSLRLASGLHARAPRPEVDGAEARVAMDRWTFVVLSTLWTSGRGGSKQYSGGEEGAGRLVVAEEELLSTSSRAEERGAAGCCCRLLALSLPRRRRPPPPRAVGGESQLGVVTEPRPGRDGTGSRRARSRAASSSPLLLVLGGKRAVLEKVPDLRRLGSGCELDDDEDDDGDDDEG